MTIYDYNVKKRNGETLSLKDLEGKVIIIFNSATGCGFTPQYEGLEKLYKEYHDKGLEILDFPCNQFGHQAPGTDEEIHAFCTAKYNTTFEQLAKINVNGENEEKLFTYLKENMKDEIINGLKGKIAMKTVEKLSPTTKKANDIKWNFTKFLVDRNGLVVKRYAPTVEPRDMEKDIKELL